MSSLSDSRLDDISIQAGSSLLDFNKINVNVLPFFSSLFGYYQFMFKTSDENFNYKVNDLIDPYDEDEVGKFFYFFFYFKN